MNKKQLLASLKVDLKAAGILRKDQDGKIQKWRDEYNGVAYGNEVTGKSRVVSKDIKKQSDWQHPTLLDPFVSTSDIVKVTPVTYEDAEAARQSETLLNYQFCRQFNRYNFLSKALKVLDQEGTVVIQTGWDYEDEEVETTVPKIHVDEDGIVQITQETVTEISILKNQPTAVVCRNEDIFIDPTCMDDMDKCQFVIHRYETDLSTLRQDGRYRNLEKVAKGPISDADTDFDDTDETEFRFEDDPRKKILVYEYWGNYDVNGDGIAEAVVCAWIGDVIIRLQSNPYPDQKPPFLVVPFNSIPFQMYGESDAELIGDNQKIKTAIVRGIIDNMAQSNNGQKGIRKGALDLVNKKRFLNGGNFEFNGQPSDFWDGSFNQIPGSAFDMLAMMNNEIESLTAVKSFSAGITGQSLGGTATGARGALDATATRKVNRVRNVSENLVKPLMRKWLAYDNEFLDDEEIVRVTNEEYVEIRRDDLAGKVDLEIQVSTAEDNAAKAQELSFLLQTLGQNMDPMMLNLIMSEIARLHKMPELEKKFRDFQPQPDPAEEKRKQLEMKKLALENEELKANITDKYARAKENGIDAELKYNKAMVEAAKARKLGSEADKLDLDFVEQDEGVKHQEKMQEKDFDRLSNLDSMAFQASHNDTNIGVKG